MDDVSRYLVREALQAVHAQALPVRSRRWVERRVERWGYDAPTHNLGGILCAAPHRHGEDQRCVLRDGRALRRFGDVRHAAGVLASTALRATARPGSPSPDLPVAGFRSTHPHAHPMVGALWDMLAGPSGDAERRFRELAADWEAFERAGVTDPIADRRLKHLAEDVRSWRTFRDAWKAGDADVTALTAQETSSNRVRWELYDLTQDARFGKDKNLRGGDIESATPALSNAAAIQRASRVVTATTKDFWSDLWSGLPWQLKAAGGAAAGLAVLGLVAEILGSASRLVRWV